MYITRQDLWTSYHICLALQFFGLFSMAASSWQTFFFILFSHSFHGCRFIQPPPPWWAFTLMSCNESEIKLTASCSQTVTASTLPRVRSFYFVEACSALQLSFHLISFTCVYIALRFFYFFNRLFNTHSYSFVANWFMLSFTLFSPLLLFRLQATFSYFSDYQTDSPTNYVS